MTYLTPFDVIRIDWAMAARYFVILTMAGVLSVQLSQRSEEYGLWIMLAVLVGVAGLYQWLEKMDWRVDRETKPWERVESVGTGLYGKYTVLKNGERQDDCFVLKPEVDPAATEALRTYANQTEDQELRSNIRGWLMAIDEVREGAA